MADICCDWLTDQTINCCFVVIGCGCPKYPTVLCSTPKNRSRWIQLVHHLSWQIAVATKYLFTSVAICGIEKNIYIHPWNWLYMRDINNTVQSSRPADWLETIVYCQLWYTTISCTQLLHSTQPRVQYIMYRIHGSSQTLRCFIKHIYANAKSY